MKAFPKMNEKQPSFQDGMDLRDWFAGHVLSKLIGGADMKHVVEAAYKWADAMMEQREIKND